MARLELLMKKIIDMQKDLGVKDTEKRICSFKFSSCAKEESEIG